MSSNILISAKNLAKIYQIYETPHDRLKQFILPRLQNIFPQIPKKQYFREFWAVKDVSLDIRRGETIGILGRNGSGKSTLLQMISGTLTPSNGHISTSGRIAALLELGSGFNPEFTGRENVYINALILGLEKADIDKRFDEIEQFADIGAFIDQPVKTYSSGMLARLAFSVAVQVSPDVLIVDEALSVGDMAFQEKSFSRMKEIRDNGTAILFVSHSISAVRNFCDRAIWLDHGEIQCVGERLLVCDAYQSALDSEIDSYRRPAAGHNKKSQHGSGNNLKTIAIKNISVSKPEFGMGEDVHIEIYLQFLNKAPSYGVGIIITDRRGTIVSIISTLRDEITLSSASDTISLTLLNNHFAPGKYDLTVSISDEKGMFSYDKSEFCAEFEIRMERTPGGLAKVEGLMRCEHAWN